MKRFLLLLAPWGAPDNWGEVKYVISQRAINSSQRIINSYTSLKPILMLAEEEVRNGGVQKFKALILSSDTYSVADPNSKDSKLRAKVERMMRDFLSSPLDYNKFVELTANRLKLFIERYSLLNYFENGVLSFIIPPGIGTFPSLVFRKTFHFVGEARDYLYVSLFLVMVYLLRDEWFLRELKEDNLELELWLDITHGMNYTITFSLELAELLGMIFSNLTARPVKLKFFQSSPFNPRNLRDPIYIHELLEREVKPLERLDILEGFPVNSPNVTSLIINKVSGYDDYWRGRAKALNTNSNIKEYLNAIFPALRALKHVLSSQRNGIILGFLSLINWQDVKNSIQQALNNIEFLACKGALEELRKSVVVVEEGERVRIERQVKLSSNISKVLYAISLAKYFSRIYDLAIREGLYLPDEECLVVDVLKEKVAGGELRKYFPLISDSFKVMVENEIGNEKRGLMRWKEDDNSEYKLLENGTPNERNFLAHAGFERRAVEYKVKDGKLLIRYRDDRKDYIRRFLK